MSKYMLQTEDDFEDNEDIDKKEIDDSQKDMLLEPYEALVYSMRKYGKPNLPYLMKATGRGLEELVADLELYQDPVRYDLHQDALEDWYMLSDYLYNKHIPRLYKEAEKMEEIYPGHFKRNLAILQKHYPKLCGLTAYDLPLGHRVVPNWLYGEIFKEILELYQAPKVTYNKVTGRYTVDFYDKPSHVKEYTDYGIKKKGFSKAITPLMNMDDIPVQDSVYDGETSKYKYVNNETDKAELMRKLKKFMEEYFKCLAKRMEDREVYEMICDRYCKSIGGYYKNTIHCDWIKIPKLDHILRDYQKDGIGAAVMNPVTFFAWGTGAGKGLGMLASASEMKRLGISKKIMMVIPNASFENFLMEIEKFFPDKEYLVIYPKKFSKKKEYYLEHIRNHGDEYEAIIMAVSSYMMLDMTKSYYLAENERETRKVKSALNAENAGNLYSEDAGILKRRLKFLEKKRKEINEKKSTVCDVWDTLGIQALFIDECQEFKNVTLKCGFAHITGVTTTGSPKCDKNMEKVHWVLRGEDGVEGRAVFATATPQKNSISETYVWQKYLSQDELAYSGMHSFQEWMKNFTEVETKPAVSQDLQSMSIQTRLKYHNLTDLHAMMSVFMNYYNIEEGKLNLPKHGPYKDVVIPATQDEIEAFEEIAEKLKDWHDGLLTSREYNPLMATIEGRAISSDIRLKYPSVVPKKGSTKAEVCSSIVCENHEKYPGTTQVVFCDLSVPKDTFNLYDEMKKHMIRGGIPEKEIAFIHDADNPVKKKQLLEDMQSAKIRVLIGSTAKAGVGLNIAQKLKVIIHYDCPYSPADLRQRNGRGIREGNENEEVIIIRLIKERSYDAVSWDRLQMKQGWIEAFNSTLMSENQRDMGDLADNSLSYGEAVAYALGKPELKRYVETENELKRMLIASRQRARELQEMNELIATIPKDIVRREQYISIIDADLAYYKRIKSAMTDTSRKEFGSSLIEAISRSRHSETFRPVTFKYQGFRVIVPSLKKDEDPYVKLQGVNGGNYKVKMDTDKPLGCCQILNHYLGTQLKMIRDRHEKQCVDGRTNMRHALEEIKKGNTYIKQIEALRMEIEKMEKEIEELNA